MRDFDFYEFVGVIVPGAVLLTGVALAWPDGSPVEKLGDLSVGGLGLGVILAYAAGHLVQAVGNLVEKAWWRAWGGMPSDWPRSSAHPLIASQQTSQLEDRVRTLLNQPGFSMSSVSQRDWYSIVRQMYAAVEKDGRSARIDVFNGNYGLCRGLAASFFALVPLVASVQSPGWGVLAGLAVAGGIALYRMHRFGIHYGRELIVQFVSITSEQPRGNAA